MAEREALALNESTPQILAPQSGDTYLLPRSFRCVGDGIFTANATSATSTRSSDAAAYTYLLRGGHAYAQAATNTTGADLTLAGGIGRRFFTITDYTAMAGSVFTLVINGTTSTKTEGVDFNAVTTNNQTATNLATALDAIAGVTAVAVAAVCYVTPDDSTYSLTISENATGATSTSGANGSVRATAGDSSYPALIVQGSTALVSAPIQKWIDSMGDGYSVSIEGDSTSLRNLKISSTFSYISGGGGIKFSSTNGNFASLQPYDGFVLHANGGSPKGNTALIHNGGGLSDTGLVIRPSAGPNTSGAGVLYLLGSDSWENGDRNGGPVFICGGALYGAGSNGNVLLAHNETVARGKVGIGTASPTKLLDVSGEMIATKIFLPYTNTATGTTGNQTINKSSGRVNIAASGTTVTVTNSLVTAATQVMAWPVTADATARVTSVVPAAGSFVINTPAVTAETAFAFVVIGAD